MISALLAMALAQPQIDLGVVYSKVGGEELKMDIYSPAEIKSGTAPAVVVIHGGAWVSGNRTDMADLCIQLASKGIVAATVSYRLAPKHKWPAMLDDVQTATRFLRTQASQYKIDPKRIGSAGASAGGHLALLLGLRETRDPKPAEHAGVSSQTQVVFNIFGPTDMANDFPPAFDMLYPMVLGKPKAEAGEVIKDASPVQWVTAQAPPIYTIHGTADAVVPVRQATRLEEAMKAQKREIVTVIVEGMPHGIRTGKPDVDEKIKKGLDDGINFLAQHLGLKS
ncbi:MAG TPA: alpha/beta hydrolase [Fimbriimonadaceae bacterium]|nr:alpha/beta hydrolase [Fimbriimonadaceae bacterium]HRJ33804.1 alpha/beta hydrolase [Fimbriimonadaceae bacterium]